MSGAPQGGRLLLVLAACGWSLSGVLIKMASLDGVTIAWYRSAVAALFLLPWAWRHRTKPDAGSLYIAVAYLGTVTLLVLATKATTAANAIILQYTAPVVVFVLGIPILRERPSPAQWGALGLSMLGVGWIFWGADADHWAGVLLGLGSGLAFGLLILCMRRFRGYNPYWLLFCNNAVVACVLLPWVGAKAWVGPADFGLMLALGVVQLGIPYVLFYRALGRVTAREGALIALLEPLLNPIWVGLFVGELPNYETRIGFAIIVVALALPYMRWPRRTL